MEEGDRKLPQGVRPRKLEISSTASLPSYSGVFCHYQQQTITELKEKKRALNKDSHEGTKWEYRYLKLHVRFISIQAGGNAKVKQKTDLFLMVTKRRNCAAIKLVCSLYPQMKHCRQSHSDRRQCLFLHSIFPSLGLSEKIIYR